MAMTRMPRASSTSAQMLPMYPAAPVTRIFICKYSTMRRGQNRRRLRTHARMARSVPKYWTPTVRIQQRLNLGQTALKGKENQVGAAADAEFVELAGDFLVRKILEERIESFLLATAEIRDGIGLQAAALAREDGIHETGE